MKSQSLSNVRWIYSGNDWEYEQHLQTAWRSPVTWLLTEVTFAFKTSRSPATELTCLGAMSIVGVGEEMTWLNRTQRTEAIGRNCISAA